MEHLDIGYNQVDKNSCFCLAHGLRLSKSILKLSLEANPIGSSGMKQLIMAKNENQIVDFELNLRLCDSEVEMATETSNQVAVYNKGNPEGPYSLKLEKIYD